MPANGTGYYQLLTPVNVGATPAPDDAHRCVTYGVKAIQKRIDELGFKPVLDGDGWLGPKTAEGIVWAQRHIGVVADGQAGPHTMKALLWPVIVEVAAPKGMAVAHAVGGICQHESGFDPGAQGFQDPADIGLVQINGPSHPLLTIAERFDARLSFSLCASVVSAALAKYGKIEPAICTWASPVWGAEWARTGHAPNPAMASYVAFVLAWQP